MSTSFTSEQLARLTKQPPQLQGMVAAQSYVPLRTVNETATPNFATQFISLWDPVKGANPATANLGSEEVQATLTLHIDHDTLGHGTGEWTITGRVASNARISITCSQVTVHYDDIDDGTPHFPQVTFAYAGGSAMPWGIRESILWSATVVWNNSYTATFTDFASTPVELYAISANLPSLYRGSGVPLELLQLFVEPACKDAGLNSVDDWVAWVVQRCHASTADNDSMVPMADRIHSFRYDVWHGASFYTAGDHSATFDLDKWLGDYKNSGAWNMVNCYDQAALVQLAVTLGVPYDRVSWMYKAPFGYIVETDLIGWGLTNNPYYGNIQDNKYSNDLGVMQPFKNHAFIAYKNSLTDELMALDACAGPHTGDQTIAAYLSSSIDNTNMITTNYYQTWVKASAAMQTITATEPATAGITSWNTITSKHVARSTGGILTYADLQAAESGSSWVAFADFVKTTPTSPKKINLGQFFIDSQAAIKARLGPDVASTAIFNLTDPRKQVVDDNTVSYRAGLDVLPPQPSAAAGATTPIAQRPLVSLTVSVLDTADQALQEIAAWMQGMSRDPSTLFTNNANNTNSLGTAHVKLTAKSPNGLNIFCYENMVVWITTQDYATGIALAADLENLLTAAMGETAVTPLSVTTSLSSTWVTAGAAVGTLSDRQPFSVSVTVAGGTASEVSLMEDDSRCYPLGPPSRAGSVWTFDFIVLPRKLWTENGDAVPEENGEDVLAFAVVAEGTQAAQAVEVSVTFDK